MRKLHLLVLLPAFFIPPSQVRAATCSTVNRENRVYVSTLTGHRVYLFDASTKTATVINDGSGRDPTSFSITPTARHVLFAASILARRWWGGRTG